MTKPRTTALGFQFTARDLGSRVRPEDRGPSFVAAMHEVARIAKLSKEDMGRLREQARRVAESMPERSET